MVDVGGGGAAANLPFLTLTNEDGLTMERKLVAGTNISLVDSGANGTLTINNTAPVAGNTLDAAYDQGGAGAGRTITADSGAVVINNAVANATHALELTRTVGTGAALVTSDGTNTMEFRGNQVDASEVLTVNALGIVTINVADDLGAVFVVNTDSSEGLRINELQQVLIAGAAGGASAEKLTVGGTARILNDLFVDADLTVGTRIFANQGLRLAERPAVIDAPSAGNGWVWIRDDAPAVLMFTDDVGTDFVLNAAVVGNTLNAAYNQGGAGAGRTITADAGAVVINNAVAGVTNTLELTRTVGTGAALSISDGTNVTNYRGGLIDALGVLDINVAGTATWALASTLSFVAQGDVLFASDTATMGIVAQTLLALESNTGNIQLTAAGGIVLVDQASVEIADGGVLFNERAAVPVAAVAAKGWLWLRSDVPNVLVFTDDDGTDFVLNAAAVGNTLDAAYNEGGAGAGRIITADAGAVVINNAVVDATNSLELSRTAGTGAALRIKDAGKLRMAGVTGTDFVEFQFLDDADDFLVTSTYAAGGGNFVITWATDGQFQANAGRVTIDATEAATSRSVILSLAGASVIDVNDADGVDQAAFAAGTVARPGITWIGNTDLGFRRATTDTVALAHGGGDRVTMGVDGVVITPDARTTGSPNAFVLTGAAHTTLTLSVEASDVVFNLARTVQFATGALALQRAVLIQAPTYAFVAGSVLTDAATVYVDKAPIAGTFATITNSYSLWVDAGITALDDGIVFVERADHAFTPAAARGILWVRDDTPNVLIFTDDVGTDHDLIAVAVKVDTFRFVGIGSIASINNLDGVWVAPRPGTIKRVTLHRKTAGGSGSTIVDVEKNAVTIFTTQANRPTVTAAGGSDQIDAHTDMDITSFAQDDKITMDIDTAETGPAKDVSVTIEVEYS
jgi:hypothetical protein